MNILLLGASGMIGQNLDQILRENNHTVIAASRQSTSWSLDLNHLPSEIILQEKLADIDVICNAIGIGPGLSDREHFQVHYHALLPILHAAQKAGVKRWIQISALSNATSEDDLAIPYLASKYAFDAALLQSGMPVSILRPSLVFSPEGESTKMFRKMALLPILLLPQAGKMQIQPLHVNDLCQAVIALLSSEHTENKVYTLGSETMSLAQYLQIMRGSRKQAVLSAPNWFFKLGMRALQCIEPAVGGHNAYRLLCLGSTTDSFDLETLLGQKPQLASQFAQK